MEGWQVFFEIPGKPPVELREGESIIGRSRNSTVHIPETTVSRQHASIQVSGQGQVVLSDLGSSNGTFVNGEKVDLQRELADGDRVMVGDAEMVIRILAPIAPSEATVRVSIPPLSAVPGATQRMDFPTAPSPFEPAPAPAAAPTAKPPSPQPTAAPAAGATPSAPPPPTPAAAPGATVIAPPLDFPLRPEAAPPARPAAPPPAPPAPAAPPRPAAPPKPAAPAAVGGEVLSSLGDLEKMPLPPPAPAAAPARDTAPGRPAVAAVPGAPRYGGFWIRVLAYVLDVVPPMLLMLVGVAATFFVSRRLGGVLNMVIYLLMVPYAFYDVWMLPATQGTTIGKRLLGLAIVTDQTRPGQGLGWGKAFVRLIGLWLSGAVLGVGFLMVAFTSKKQGLHDLIAGTYVVRTR